MKKKIILAISILCICNSIHAQTVSPEMLAAKKTVWFGSKSYKSIAKEIQPTIYIDDNGAISYAKILEFSGKTKDQLFSIANSWANKNFNMGESMIRSVDGNTGTIVVQGYISNAVEHIGGENVYHINLKPVIKVQVKEEKARIIFTMPAYNVHKEEKSGSLFRPNSHYDEIWNIKNCYPFNRSTDLHEITSAKALVMTHICAKLYIDFLENVLTNSVVENDADDW